MDSPTIRYLRLYTSIEAESGTQSFMYYMATVTFDVGLISADKLAFLTMERADFRRLRWHIKNEYGVQVTVFYQVNPLKYYQRKDCLSLSYPLDFV